MSDGKIIIDVSINENGILEIGGKQMSNGKVTVDVVINKKENLLDLKEGLEETNRLLRVIASNTEKPKPLHLQLGGKVLVNGEWMENHDLNQKE